MGFRVGVDIGGSFTDFAVLDDADGSIRSLKVFSRPDSPGSEVLDGVAALGARYGISPADIVYFTHGTTVGINSVIQRNGLKLGLFVTKGFVDVLELARLKTSDMYDFFAARPSPLIPRSRVYPIRERIDADGNPITALDRSSLESMADAALREGCEGIVVSFLLISTEI